MIKERFGSIFCDIGLVVREGFERFEYLFARIGFRYIGPDARLQHLVQAVLAVVLGIHQHFHCRHTALQSARDFKPAEAGE